MSKTLKWGIVGCGTISQLHCVALEFVENAELYAVCDIIEERAKEKAAEFGAKKIYTSYQEMLLDPEIDAVSICTPSGMHGEMCIQAALAGKHILCEKPMEITADKMQKIIDCIEETNVKMGCVFQRRCENKFKAVKDAIASGRFGKVILADAYLKYYRSQEYYDSADWRATWELDGGGALMNQGVHGIDLLIWIAGDVESVFARCGALVRNIEVEDTAIASLKFKNGALGNIEGTTSVYPGMETLLEIHCEKGSIVIGDSGIKEWKIENSDEEAPVIEAPTFAIKDDPAKLPYTSHVAPYQDLADAILYDRKPAITPQEARKSVDLILAIYRSSQEKREIML